MALFQIGGKFVKPAEGININNANDQILVSDFLYRESGMTRDDKIAEAKLKAITKPSEYLTERQNAIKAATKDVAVTFAQTYQNLYDAGYQDNVAKNYATNLANLLVNERVKIINETYPIDSSGLGAGLNLLTNKLINKDANAEQGPAAFPPAPAGNP